MFVVIKHYSKNCMKAKLLNLPYKAFPCYPYLARLHPALLNPDYLPIAPHLCTHLCPPSSPLFLTSSPYPFL